MLFTTPLGGAFREPRSGLTLWLLGARAAET